MPVVSSSKHLFAKPLLYTQFGMVSGSIIAILIACALLMAPLKTALDDYLGLGDEEEKHDE